MKIRITILPLLLLLLPNVGATHDSNDFFVNDANFPGITWNDIHGVSGRQFAVGQTNTGAGAIATRTTGTWALQTVPVGGPITQVVVISTTLAYAFSAGRLDTVPGTPNWVWKWDGTSWARYFQPDIGAFGSADTAIWAFANDNFYTAGIVTNSVIAQHFNNAADSCPGVITESISDIFPVGTNYTFYGFGTYTQGTQTGSTNRLYSISPYTSCASQSIFSYVTALNDGWSQNASFSGIHAVGDGGLIIKGDTVIASPTTNDLDSVWGISSTDIYAVGDFGTIIHYDGVSWVNEDSMETTTNDATGVYCTDISNCWITFSSGLIQRLQVNPALTLPNTTGFSYDPDNDYVSVSQAQCLGDNVTTVHAHTPAIMAGDAHTHYVINSEKNVVVQTITGFSIDANLYYASRLFPAGDYMFLIITDRGGLGQDTFIAHAFNVPEGSCYTPDDSRQHQVDKEEIIGTITMETGTIATSLDNSTLVFVSLAILVLLILWAEISQNWLLYLTAILADATIILSLWEPLSHLRMIYVIVILILALRGFYMLREETEEPE